MDNGHPELRCLACPVRELWEYQNSEAEKHTDMLYGTAEESGLTNQILETLDKVAKAATPDNAEAIEVCSNKIRGVLLELMDNVEDLQPEQTDFAELERQCQKPTIKTDEMGNLVRLCGSLVLSDQKRNENATIIRRRRTT